MPESKFNFDPFIPSFERPEATNTPEKLPEFAIPLAPALRQKLLISQHGIVQKNIQSNTPPLSPTLFKIFEP